MYRSSNCVKFHPSKSYDSFFHCSDCGFKRHDWMVVTYRLALLPHSWKSSTLLILSMYYGCCYNWRICAVYTRNEGIFRCKSYVDYGDQSFSNILFWLSSTPLVRLSSISSYPCHRADKCFDSCCHLPVGMLFQSLLLRSLIMTVKWLYEAVWLCAHLASRNQTSLVYAMESY
jgi:hypothetical protein